MKRLDRKLYRVRFVQWDSVESTVLKRIRFSVFVEEQKVPAEMELDELDSTAVHALAENSDGEACGVGRMFAAEAGEPGCIMIGRMAVLKDYRNTGCGAAIMTALLAEAQRLGFAKAALSAQTHALAFYEQAGFTPEGDVYYDAGIPHQKMTMKL